MLISRSLTILAMVLLTLVVGSPVRAQEDAADDGDGIEVVDEIETPAAVDVPKPAPPVEDSAPATQSTEEPASTSPTFVDELPKLRVRRQANPDEVFGRYRVRVGMARPRFDDGLKFYDELYGKTSWYPTLSADWFAWDWYATLGLSFRGGYYTDRGHAGHRIPSGRNEQS